MKKILIIEDNEDLCENAADILELANYNVSTSENAKCAIDIAKKIKPDIILYDILMPELKGLEVFQMLSKNNETASIPFIFLTPKTDKLDCIKEMSLGVGGFLTKPFTENELLDAVNNCLQKRNFLNNQLSRDITSISKCKEDASSYLNLRYLSKNIPVKKYKRKELVFMEGSTAHSLYFIESGVLKTYKTTEKGKEFVTGLYGSGDFVAQLSLLANTGLYLESASVIEDAEIYQISKSDFTTLFYGDNEVTNKFVSLISNNLAEVQEQLVNIAFATVRQRVARALLCLQEKGILTNGDSTSIRITRDDFAGIIGTATETAIRMLTEFKEERLISIGNGRKIVIENNEALKHIAKFG